MNKGYIVEHPSSGHGRVVLAETAGKARAAALGDDIFHDCEFLDPTVRRAKEFDGLEESPTIKELVENHGWFLECPACGSAVMAHDEHRVWTDSETVFHGEGCKEIYEERVKENGKSNADN